jgi:hypothetical protein
MPGGKGYREGDGVKVMVEMVERSTHISDMNGTIWCKEIG